MAIILSRLVPVYISTLVSHVGERLVNGPHVGFNIEETLVNEKVLQLVHRVQYFTISVNNIVVLFNFSAYFSLE